MKTKHILFCGICAVMFAVAFAACKNPSGGGGGGGEQPDPVHTHNWGAWAATDIAGTEERVCKSSSSHIEHRLTGTGRFIFDLISGTATYTVSQGTATVGTVRIPAYYRPNAESEYQPVTAIGSPSYSNQSGGFAGWSNLIGIIIPESVTSIGGGAFSNSPLATVTFAAGSQLATIGASAFQNCTNLASITIPAGVTSLPDGVANYYVSNGTYTYDGLFSGCTSLATVTFAAGSQLESIGNYAFSGCTKLASITIPASVTSIGYSRYSGNLVFLGCSSLTSITVSANNPNYASEGGILYNKEKTTLAAYPSASGNVTLTLPASVSSIGNYAFVGCSSLTSITIPTGITSIGYGAFYGCTGLTSISIPASVYNIEKGLLYEGDGAFSGCTSLTSITVDAGNPSYTGEGGMLYNKGKTTLVAYPSASGNVTLDLPASVTSIGDYAFFDYGSLTSITIPEGVTSIGDYAFLDCRRLTSIIIPSTVTSISGSAFSGTPWLASQPNGLVYAGTVLYQYRGTMPANTVISNIRADTIGIADGAFSDRTNLTSITLPEGITSIGNSAFYGCTGLPSITLPNSVTSIGDRAFSGCTGLTFITIPPSVTSIGSSAFYNWAISQTIYVEGYTSQATADAAWGYWRGNCNATIKYLNGSVWV